MDGWFDFVIFLALLATAATIAWRVYRGKTKQEAAIEAARKEDTRSSERSSYSSGYRSSSYDNTSSDSYAPLASRILGFVTLGLWIFTAVALGTSCTSQVSTKHVGVVTSFGKPVGYQSNGLHLKAPWENVTELDATIQTDSHSGTDKNDTTPCTQVRIANQNTACVDNSVRWRIRGDQSDELFQDYKDTEHVRDSIVTRKLGEILNLTFKDYDPLAVDKDGNSTAPSQDFLSEQASKLLAAAIGDKVQVLEVIVSFEHFDPNTEDRLHALQAEAANTRIAKQKQLTADAEAIANDKIAASISHDPYVLVNKCFDIMAQMVKDKQPIPPGTSCWPNSSGAVVLPSVGAGK